VLLVVKVPLRDWLRVTVGVELKEVVGHWVPVGLIVLVTQVDREKLGVPLRESDTVGDVQVVGDKESEGDGVYDTVLLVVKVPLLDWLRVTVGVELKEVVGHCVPVGLMVYVTVGEVLKLWDTVAQVVMESLFVILGEGVGLPLKLTLLVGSECRRRTSRASLTRKPSIVVQRG
jgi:hypothetical protein